MASILQNVKKLIFFCGYLFQDRKRNVACVCKQKQLILPSSGTKFAWNDFAKSQDHRLSNNIPKAWPRSENIFKLFSIRRTFIFSQRGVEGLPCFYLKTWGIFFAGTCEVHFSISYVFPCYSSFPFFTFQMSILFLLYFNSFFQFLRHAT